MQVQLLVWIFVMRIMMIIASGLSYFINEAIAKARYGNVDKMNFEAPLTSLVWLTSIVSVVAHLRRVVLADPGPRRRHAVVEAVDDHHLRHAGRRDHPELVKVFTSTESSHVKEVVTSSREGGAVAEHPVRASSPATSAPTGSA